MMRQLSIFPPQPVLLIDDDEPMLRSYGSTLRDNGITNILECGDSRNVASLLAGEEMAAVLLDLKMPHVTGEEILAQIAKNFPGLPVIVVTATDEVDTAVRCMSLGAFDYMLKPVDVERLVTGVRRAIETQEIRRENRLLTRHFLSDALLHPETFREIVTRNKQMYNLFQYVEAIAETSQPVLITGETGVGKELLARAVHTLSKRHGEFVALNVGGVDDNVFSDTLFGHVKGAFTDAQESRKGLIEHAAGGTLFLDEIGELSNASQVKLLRLLQEREYRTLGSDIQRRTNARIVVSTNRDIKALKESGQFRDDLYFRLCSHHVRLPPLRERPDDLPLLIEHFLRKAAAILGKPVPTPPHELDTLLAAYHFPGNIRELEGMILDAVSRHKSGILSMDAFKEIVLPACSSGKPASVGVENIRERLFSDIHPLPTIEQAERMLIAEAMRRSNGNQTIAAELLGIARQTLNRRLGQML